MVAPATAAVVPMKFITTLAVPTVGAVKRQISTPWLPEAWPILVMAKPPYVMLDTGEPAPSMPTLTNNT